MINLTTCYIITNILRIRQPLTFFNKNPPPAADTGEVGDNHFTVKHANLCLKSIKSRILGHRFCKVSINN